jgi:hypothetical protein
MTIESSPPSFCRSAVPAEAGTHAKGRQELRLLQAWIPAFERVKKSPNWFERLKSSPQRRPRAGGDPYKRLFQLDKWIPAFAGMTLRSLPEARNSDSFTRSFAGMTPYPLSPLENRDKVRGSIL